MKRFVKPILSLLLLAGTLYLVGARELAARIALLDPGLTLVAAATCALQFPLLAARWWLFARWLGVPLGYRRAVGEYTLSTLLNQLLPLGVLGDVLRLARHARAVRRQRPDQPALDRVALALLLDRASGQLALWLWVSAVAAEWWRSLRAAIALPALAVAAVAVLLVAALLGWLARRRGWQARALFGQGARALLSPRRLLVHLPLSLALVALHVAAFALVARALATDSPLGRAAVVVPPLLVAGTLPGFFAGWGVREAAAAGLYALSGLRPADGAAASLIWGALGLLASTPGVLFWSRAEPPAELGQAGS